MDLICWVMWIAPFWHTMSSTSHLIVVFAHVTVLGNKRQVHASECGWCWCWCCMCWCCKCVGVGVASAMHCECGCACGWQNMREQCNVLYTAFTSVIDANEKTMTSISISCAIQCCHLPCMHWVSIATWCPYGTTNNMPTLTCQ